MKTKSADKQLEQQRSFITHPTIKHVLIFVTIWVVGNGLLLISMTDLFRESFISEKYIMIYVMMVMSTWTTFKVVRNHIKTKART